MTINNVFNTVMGMFIGIVILSALVALTTTLYVKKSPAGTKSPAPGMSNPVRDVGAGNKRAGIISRVLGLPIPAKFMSLVKRLKTPAPVPEPVFNPARIIAPAAVPPVSAPVSNTDITENAGGNSQPRIETVNNPAGSKSLPSTETENNTTWGKSPVGTEMVNNPAGGKALPGTETFNNTGDAGKSLPGAEMVNNSGAGQSLSRVETVSASAKQNGIDASKTENKSITPVVSVTSPEPKAQSEVRVKDIPKESASPQATDPTSHGTSETNDNKSKSSGGTEPEKASGSVFDIFKNVAVEESDSSKFAANVDNVDINDLKSLVGQLNGGRKR